MIAAGADFRERPDSGFTPFLFAVRESGRACSRAGKAGADVNDTVPLTDGRRPAGRPGSGNHRARPGCGERPHPSLRPAAPPARRPERESRRIHTALHAVTWVRIP
ncbi:MAG: hypothetical protein IPM24_28535 [Bryobacterales bacterium]|nr:hypothetical protein [Bryobacterales bacterium]